ncbi:MAG TPA: DUF2399 domain-containing protein [Acidimicrobiales bacterium]|nr:DUF2399 domain-containing protein [Acidimicrobiales bacterium]
MSHSLADPALAPLWRAVVARLERSDRGATGRLAVPPLPQRGVQLLALLTGARTGARPGASVDLSVVEQRLVAFGLGDDLVSALAALGHPVSSSAAERRAVARAAAAARQAARDAVAEWPESWAAEFADGLVRSGGVAGLGADDAVALVVRVRAVLSSLDGTTVSRVELAARVLGDAHALDRGSRIEAAVARALACRAGLPQSEARAAWAAAGIDHDLVSAPALTWGLRLVGRLGEVTGAATDLGVPVHLSSMALRSWPSSVAAGQRVLVVENPRLVEAAAQRRVPFAVVATNGQPSTAVRLLVDQLLAGCADLGYHGDFDSAGLRMCLAMHHWGVPPWRMTADDYLAAVSPDLPLDPAPPPPTPWSPSLHDAFAAERRIVHEERLVDALLGDG